MKKPTAKQMLKNWNKGAKKRQMKKLLEQRAIAKSAAKKPRD